MKRVLVVGGGSIGERHVRCFLATQRAEVGICEISDDIRQHIVATYQLQRSHSSYEQALDTGYDAVVICTPAHLHVRMAMEAAQRQVAALIEKPLSVSLDGISELQALVDQNRAPMAIAYVTRHHPALNAMRIALQTGRWGDPVEIVLQSGQHFPFYRPAYRDIYYANHATGGGAIQDALTHMLNASEWLVGPINRVVADAAHLVLDGVDVEDTVHLATRHTGSHREVLGSFALNQHQAVNETLLTVVCSQGVVRYEASACRWLSCQEPNSDWKQEQAWSLERDDLFVAQAAAFLDVLNGVAEPHCTLAEGLQTLRVNLAALESLKTESWIRL